jgi:hypothetical protein
MGGTWLLDPEYDISIVAGGAGANSNTSGAPDFTPTNDDSFIGADLITAQLNAGTSVIISTSNPAGPGLGQTGNISVTGDIFKATSGVATLTLNAAGKIDLQASVSSVRLASLDLNLTAGSGGVNLDSAATIGVGDLTIVSNNGGSVTLTGTVFASTLSVDIPVVYPPGSPVPTFHGAIFINNAANQIGTINGLTAQEGIVLRDSSGGLVINGFVTPTQHNGSGLPGGISQFNAILRTVGDFTINPGATIFANSNGDIFIEAKDGYFINNSGSPFNQGLGGGSGWAIYSASDATTAQGGRFNDGGLFAAQAPIVAGTNPVFNTSVFPAGLGAVGNAGTDITTKTFYFASTGTGVPIGAGGSGGGGTGGGGTGGGGSGGVTKPGTIIAASDLTSQAVLEAQYRAAAQRSLERQIAQSLLEASNTPPPIEPPAAVKLPKLQSRLFSGSIATLKPNEVDAIAVEEWKKADALLNVTNLYGSKEGKEIMGISNALDEQRREFASYTRGSHETFSSTLSKEEYDDHIQEGLRKLDSLRQDLAAAEERLLAKIATSALIGGTNALVFVDNVSNKILFVLPEIDPNGKPSLEGLTKIGPAWHGLVGASGSTLVGASGSTLVGMSGSTLIGHDGSGLIGHDGSGAIQR